MIVALTRTACAKPSTSIFSSPTEFDVKAQPETWWYDEDNVSIKNGNGHGSYGKDGMHQQAGQ